jgi:hypothetical protein
MLRPMGSSSVWPGARHSFGTRNQFFFLLEIFFKQLHDSKSKSHFDLQSVGHSVLASGAHLGPATNFSFSLKFYLDSCELFYFVAPSMTRERVCNLLLLLGLASAVPLRSALSDERSGLSFVSISL